MMLKRILMAGAALAAFSAPAQAQVPAQTDELRDALSAYMPALMKLYRDLHQCPELSFEEVKTAT